MKRKKFATIETIKSKYGMMFVTPWLIGMIIFFIVPIAQTLWFSFCEVIVDEKGMITNFVGIENYKYIINTHPQYLNHLTETVTSIGYTLPAILVISIILAIILNGKFKGRIVFRALYFLPVIIATGVVMQLLFQVDTDFSGAGMSDEASMNMISFEDVIKKLSLPEEFSEYLQIVLNNIFTIIWNCGIQIVLFLAGLQSIPEQLYEVSKVEGCTKWEEFWYITFPMLSRTTVLVIVFTVVELLTAKDNSIMTLSYQMLRNLNYGVGSAMLWVYFAIIGAVLGIILLVFNQFCVKRWE